LNIVNKSFEFLNDMYQVSIGKDLYDQEYEISDVPAKGILSLGNHLYQVSKNHNNKNEIFFFCEDLTKFFIFNLINFTFTKVLIKFSIPEQRSNFTITPLTDGRIILFGGLDYENNKAYYETYQLIKFGYFENSHYLWSDIDVFGTLNDEAFLGHQAILLDNDHILFHGGAKESYNPLKDYLKFSLFDIKQDKKINITSRFKILDVYNTYQWREPLSIFFFIL